MKKTILVLFTMVTLVVTALFFFREGDTPKDSPLQALAIGNMAKFVAHGRPRPLPDIPFEDPQGRPVTLEHFSGKIILLNIWATWCAPCRHEMPALDKLNQNLKNQDFEVVILSMDRSGRQKVLDFLEDIKITSLEPYLDSSGKFSRSAGALGLPVTLLISRNGEELGRLTGPAEWNSDEARALVLKAQKLF